MHLAWFACGTASDSDGGGDADAGLDAGVSDAGETDAGPTTDADPSLRLAFASNRSGDYEIYLARADGSDLRQLTSSPGFDLFPAWSPDATRLYFASSRAGPFQLYSQSLGGGPAALVPTGLYAATAPAISPDGLRVAFEGRTSGSATSDIYLMPLPGGAITQLTTNAANEAGPAWSPDGATLYFVSNRTGTYELYAMASTGAGQRALTTGLDVLGRPAAATGRVAFAQLGAGMKSMLVVLELATSSRSTLSAQSDGEPAFSSDGRRLVASSARYGNPELVTLDAFDGRAVTRVTNHPAIDGTPAFSPVAF